MDPNGKLKNCLVLGRIVMYLKTDLETTNEDIRTFIKNSFAKLAK
jgi:hypothetical protein